MVIAVLWYIWEKVILGHLLSKTIIKDSGSHTGSKFSMIQKKFALSLQISPEIKWIIKGHSSTDYQYM